MNQAMKDVLTERKRQQDVKGWTVQHDDGHDGCELGHAAACYAAGVPLPGFWPRGWVFKDSGDGQLSDGHRRMLVKAGALILAEIERIDRLHGSPLCGNPSPSTL